MKSHTDINQFFIIKLSFVLDKSIDHDPAAVNNDRANYKQERAQIGSAGIFINGNDECKQEGDEKKLQKYSKKRFFVWKAI